MKVFIDGIPIQNPTDNLLEPKFTLRRKDEDGVFAVSFTGELDFTGADYTYIYAKLVTDPNAINNFIVLLFVDDCCENKEYQFMIKPESLKWCTGKCEITANAVEYSPESQAYTCMENTLVWDNWNNFKTASHPRMKYCLEYRPSLLQDAMLILGLFTVFGATTILAMFATLLLPLIGLVNAIVTAINTLLPSGDELGEITIGGFDDPIDIFNYVKDLFESTNGTLIAGCGYEHPSPLVRSYLSNVCGKCGLTYQSSIFNEPNSAKPNNDYYNLVYFSAPVKSGRIGLPFFKKPLVPFIEENEPIHNGKTFNDEILKPFNGAWDIVGTTVRLERHDYFETQIPWFDVTTYDPEKVVSECFEWSKQRRPAYATIGYQRDAIDWCGSEATDRWSDIIEWNLPVNPLQKGAFDQLFPYSTARFRDDGIERDVLSDYDWMPYGIGQNIKDGRGNMIMNSGISFVPKLLIWDGQSYSDGKVKRWTKPGSGTDQAVNYPMWVDANIPDNLYDRFWQIENPRNASFSGQDYTITVIWDCATVNAVNVNGTVMTSQGLSKTIESIDLDFSNSTMVIRGTV